MIDHLEQECTKASVICLTCENRQKREDQGSHKCTQELIKNVKATDNATLKSALLELDRKNTQDHEIRDARI